MLFLYLHTARVHQAHQSINSVPSRLQCNMPTFNHLDSTCTNRSSVRLLSTLQYLWNRHSTNNNNRERRMTLGLSGHENHNSNTMEWWQITQTIRTAWTRSTDCVELRIHVSLLETGWCAMRWAETCTAQDQTITTFPTFRVTRSEDSCRDQEAHKDNRSHHSNSNCCRRSVWRRYIKLSFTNNTSCSRSPTRLRWCSNRSSSLVCHRVKFLQVRESFIWAIINCLTNSKIKEC